MYQNAETDWSSSLFNAIVSIYVPFNGEKVMSNMQIVLDYGSEEVDVSTF